MTNRKNTPDQTAATTACCGACDCANCSCGCPKGSCQCESKNCNCGCRTTENSR